MEEESWSGSEEPTNTHVTVKIQGEGQNDVWIKVRRSVPLKKVMLAYCCKLDLRYEVMRFTFNGKRIYESNTADDLGMEDHDVVDAWFPLLGGAGAGDSVFTVGVVKLQPI